MSENRYGQIYLKNIYKNQDCLGSVADLFFFFFFFCRVQKQITVAEFLSVGWEIGKITFLFKAYCFLFVKLIISLSKICLVTKLTMFASFILNLYNSHG